MEKTRSPVLAGYDLAIAKVRDMHQKRTGKTRGAVAWLAGKLGISRQTVDNWHDRNGFPPEYVGRVAKIVGLKPDEIRPVTVIKEIPELAWDGICTVAPRALTDQAVDVARRK